MASPVYVPRPLPEREAWVRDFAATHDVVVIDDAVDVLADLAQRRTPAAPASPPVSDQLCFDDGEAR